MALLVRAGDGGVNSHHFCEIPVIGPGRANRLVMITGIAICGTKDTKGLDVNRDDIVSDEVFITTEYHLGKNDNWLGLVKDQDMFVASALLSCSAFSAADPTGMSPSSKRLCVPNVTARP